MTSTTLLTRLWKQWKDWIFLLLGITLPVLFGNLFSDDFYLAIILTTVILLVVFWVFVRSAAIKYTSMALTLVCAGAMAVYHWSVRPTFDIHLIGLPYPGDPAYYVSDAMIRTKGDLSAYGDFTVAPLQVEVIPNYTGAEKFANIVLRLSGAHEMTRDIKLWDEFDNRPRTVSLPLTDVISISGIQETREELETSLGLDSSPYPQAQLKLQVVLLSDVNSILSEKIVSIKNTTWTQKTRLVNRDGFAVDYAVENLGPPATFYCHAIIARAKADVGAGDHSFWSGIEYVNGMNCESFHLYTGETHAQSLLIDEETLGAELSHGRYLVEVYTFADRADVTFHGDLDFETSSQSWIFANAADLLTFVVCHDPGQDCKETYTYPIEQDGVDSFSWMKPESEYTYLRVNSYPVGNRIANQYILDYWLDPQIEGTINLSLVTRKPEKMDVSQFNTIRFRINLGEIPVPVWLDVTSHSGDVSSTQGVLIGEGMYGQTTGGEQLIEIPFSAFPQIDWAAVEALNFSVSSDFASDSEQHQFRVSEIEFAYQY